jgi:type II secretory pathway pseudopilin PulG
VSSHGRQMLGSLVVAAIIVAIAIIAVTAKLGPTSAAELESREELQKQRLEQQEERREEREDRLKEGSGSS